jgi:hypothetical protein
MCSGTGSKMNPRIKQLFEQALEEFNAENKYATIIVPNPLKEKFAELIVQECVEICMKEFDTGLLMAPQAPWIAKQIKEHFGVEE